MASSATRRTLFTVLSRSISSSSSSSSSFLLPSPPISSRLRLAFPLLNRQDQIIPTSFNLPIRFKASGSGYSPLNDPSPNWSNRPPKETILLDGCDYEHWLIVLEFPNDPKPSEEEMVNTYVKTLAAVVGSEEEAKKKIYSVSTTTYTGFGALISEELSYKVKELPGVLWVLPDSYLDVPNKDYGGDLFIDGKVIPRPQYRYHDRPQQPGRNRPRPRYDRRRETMQVDRRQPFQRQNWGQNQSDPMQPPPSIDGQNRVQSGVGDFSTNPGEFNRSNTD